MFSKLGSVLSMSSVDRDAVIHLPKPAHKDSRALSASWYRTDELYQLERRAIFSKRWLLTTHKLRFRNPGDFFRFEQAGYAFVLILHKDGQTINGFHNICRHKAFPIVTENSGNAKILSCKYHGWSYGINGKLAKAPRFDTVPDFNKEDHSLFPVHVHVDAIGFVWVNLDASPEPEVKWSDDLEGADTQERFKNYDFSQYQFDHVWSMPGNYNWKTLADNYNECYHCQVAHPDVRDMSDLSFYYTISKPGYIQHFQRPKKEKENEDIKIVSTYYFPNACMTVSPHFFYMMRCVPTSVGTCSMEYEVYRHKDATDEDFEKVDSFFKRVLGEDKCLCDAVQKNLEAGVFTNGELHPDLESAPLFFQKTVRHLLAEHSRQEQDSKAEIWPARRPTADSGFAKGDDEFCNRLACKADQANMEW
ncbi:cytochrome p450 oxidoreductase [Fusarium longipes]|uniref:Choline monooxygenase, chloroplastic n=1 Tax=Fusarium longipes TaxID=694270 RepID=A0A395SGM4_9HYPO|nr:cytochrome p450 oxidoreductase [Fusarium longipes]